MKTKGFTFVELLIVILILTIVAAGAIPSFKQSIQNARTKTAQHELLGAIEHARSLAVFSGSRSVIRAKNKWHDGWEIFLDKDNDGIPDESEPILYDRSGLSGVVITGNNPVKKRISFIGTGEARAPGRANAGAFTAGSLKICPISGGDAYKLVLARGGRMRSEEIDASDCE